jgi:hypothetical protein
LHRRLQNVKRCALRRQRVIPKMLARIILAPFVIPAILVVILALRIAETTVKAFQRRVPLRWEVVGVGKRVFLREL